MYWIAILLINPVNKLEYSLCKKIVVSLHKIDYRYTISK